MNPDNAKIDEAVLALLWLNEQAVGVAWKSFDWDALSRLHARELISNPVKKAKSVYLTEEGFEEGRRLFDKLFGKAQDPSQ